jgi:hypothetical protein
MFKDNEVNAAGCYLFKFHINGVKTAVMVDDYIPYQGSSAWFSDGKLWVLLLEKAFAKLMGCYVRTTSCPIDLVCSLITGVYS